MEYIPDVSKPPQRKIEMQSQLRMGSYDFDQNYEHVQMILDCLNDTFMNADTEPEPCSVNA